MEDTNWDYSYQLIEKLKSQMINSLRFDVSWTAEYNANLKQRIKQFREN